ncbi:hypothetical protein Fcan01_10378 [Folsomia candida]|uniref:Uncharacterized protein n=1 Tax=Folsomia candida TaxID=158441 RepID=A0A226E7R5_FOLCA|nr:hypothetical protein Fcan01_10378 [Folsomia candida]
MVRIRMRESNFDGGYAFPETELSKKYILIGLILHSLIFTVIAIPFCAALIPIILDNMDPTYFLFRNVTFLSYHVKLLLRIFLIIIVVLQCTIAALGFAIILSNVLLLLVMSLENITPMNTSFYRKMEFAKFFIQYRQLQILNRIWNNVCYLTFSLGLFLPLVAVVLLGYTLIKLRSVIPFPLTFLVAGGYSSKIERFC